MSVIIIAALAALLAGCGAAAPANPTTPEISDGLPTAEATDGADLSTTLTPVEAPTLLVETNEPTSAGATAETGATEQSTPGTDTTAAATPSAAATSGRATATSGTTTDTTTTTGTTTGTSTSETTTTTGTATSGGAMTDSELTVSAEGVELEFSETTMTAPAGEQVSVTFENNASGLQHNWVLVRGGEEVATEVNQSAMTNAPDFAPPADSPDVIAATDTIDPGESDTVDFTIDEPGSYIYLCTVPGHYQAGMAGTLTVE